MHGRLYISQNWLCFYANIFGWETFVSIKKFGKVWETFVSNIYLTQIVVPENVISNPRKSCWNSKGWLGWGMGLGVLKAEFCKGK